MQAKSNLTQGSTNKLNTKTKTETETQTETSHATMIIGAME
jgi:hypothetical protein